MKMAFDLKVEKLELIFNYVKKFRLFCRAG